MKVQTIESLRWCDVANHDARVRASCCVATNCGGDVVNHHFGFSTSKRVGWQGDFLVIPLCFKHHQEVHAGKKTFYEKYNIDPYGEAAKIYVQFLDGQYEKEEALKRLVCEEE